MMRDALRVMLHDAEQDLIVEGFDTIGVDTYPSEETIQLDYQLREWLSWLVSKTYTKKLSDDAFSLCKFYKTPDVNMSRIRAEVTAPGVLELEITYLDGFGALCTERATYCGSFQVWWKTDANDS